MNFDFPVFSLLGNNFLDEKSKEAIIFRENIDNLINYLEDLSNDIIIHGKKINLYINNISNTNITFDYLKHIMIFEFNQGKIYNVDCINNFVENKIKKDKEILIDDIYNHVKPLDVIKLNRKQINNCKDMFSNYNNLYNKYENDYNNLIENFNNYDLIIEEVKKFLCNVDFFKVYKNKYNFDLENFDLDKHELFLTQDINSKSWHFIYINKSNKNDFIKMINNKQLV